MESFLISETPLRYLARKVRGRRRRARRENRPYFRCRVLLSLSLSFSLFLQEPRDDSRPAVSNGNDVIWLLPKIHPRSGERARRKSSLE